MAKTATRNEKLFLAAAVAVALGLRLDGLGWGLPALYEEATPFRRAWEMWGFGALRRFDLDPHFFKYPSLTVYLQLAGQALTFAALRVAGIAHSWLDVRVLYATDRTPFIVTGRAITALLGAATVLPAWSLARRAAGPRAALVAALLVAIHPALIAKSRVIEVDVPLTALATAGLALAAALADAPSRGRAFAAGLVAGLATSAKYSGLGLAAPLALAAWLGGRGRGTRLGLAALGLLAGFLLTSPYALLDFAGFRVDLAVESQHQALGHFGLAGGPAFPIYARAWFASLMGWPLGIAALLGIAWAAARRRRWAWIVAAFFVPYVAIVGSWQVAADRYLLPLIPAGIVAAAALLEEGAAWAGARFGGSAPLGARAATLASAAGAALLALPLLAQYPAQWRGLGTDTRTRAQAWIASHMPAGSFLLCEELSPEIRSPLTLPLADPEVMAALARRGATGGLDAVQTMPMFQVAPERSAKYYDLAHWRQADAILVTSSVRDRYRSDPARFATQLAFYDALERAWPRAARFAPDGGPGPEIVIYRNPAALAPFGSRATVPGPDTTLVPARLSAAEGFTFYNLGLNDEAFGHLPEAQACYLLALRYGATEPDAFVSAAVRLAETLREQGRAGAALGLLGECIARAPGPREAAELAQVGAALQAGVAFTSAVNTTVSENRP